MKKLIATVLTLITLVSTLSLGAAAEGFTYKFDKHSKALFMVSMDDGSVIYSDNADEKLPIASLTKMMSYIVAYENIPDIETVKITVDESVATILNSTNSSLAGVVVGEELTGLQLLNLMMVPSGNDASLVLCQYVDALKGSTVKDFTVGEDGVDSRATNMEGSAFVQLMNDKAKELGCENTHFTNPHGLYDADHYSTARDMATIARYATTLPYFTEITGSPSYTKPVTNKSKETVTLANTNRMFSQSGENVQYYYSYATGIKTGSLNESGYCIAASARCDSYSYIVIALGSPMLDAQGQDIELHGEMLDAIELFEWAFMDIEQKTIATKGDLVGDVQMQYAWGKDRLQIVAEDNVQALLPKSVSNSSVIVTTDIPERVQAPIKKGDIIGTATFSYADETIAKINVVAAESVERSEIIQTLEVGKDVVTSPIFLIIAGIIILILVIYFTSIFVYNHKKKRMRKVKKYRDL